MPELPEVEVAAQSFMHWALGRRVREIAVFDRRALTGGRSRELSTLIGARLTDVLRIGKNLLLTFHRGRVGKSPPVIGVWSHLGMTGKWLRRAPGDSPPRFARIRLDFVAGPTMYFVDMRLFGFFRLVADADFMRLPPLAALGPDPLREGIDTGRLVERLRRSRQPIKVAILDQSLIPGVGNIQASEGLYRAGIDPRRPAASLGAADLKRLARSLLTSFRYTLRAFERAGVLPSGGASVSDVEYVEESGTRNPFRVYDRVDVRCRRCRRGTITRIVQAGRSTYFCPNCQR